MEDELTVLLGLVYMYIYLKVAFRIVILTAQVVLAGGKQHTLYCRHLINAGGPWASKLALMAGIGQADHVNPVMRVELPVRPRRRMIFVFKCPDGPSEDCPMVVDPSGLHFRREGSGGVFIVGCPPKVSTSSPICSGYVLRGCNFVIFAVGPQCKETEWRSTTAVSFSLTVLQYLHEPCTV